MNIPFTTAQFFDIFTHYNESVWPAQIILNVLALAVVILLYRARRSGSRIIAAVLSSFWAWMAVAYHFVFFANINPAAWLFGAVFLAGAAWFAWIGVFTNGLRFLPNGGVRGWTGAALILFSLLIAAWAPCRSSLPCGAYLRFALSNNNLHDRRPAVCGAARSPVCVHRSRALGSSRFR